MRIYTFKELEEMDVIELNKLCRVYGMTPVQFRTYSWKQKIAFVRAKQILGF